VQPDRGPEIVREQHEGPRAQAGRDSGGDVGALRAEVVGDEADDEKRGQVAEMERGLDQPRVL
jgi:hypothetical protein